MAISIAINGSVTLDESDGLQSNVAAAPPEDNNDNDVSLATLQADPGALVFYSRLFTAGGLNLSSAFATANGVARSASNYISLSGTGTINSLGFVTAAGTALPVYSGGATSATGATCNLTALDGGVIGLFSDSVLGNRVVYGVDTQGHIVFAMFMDPAAGLTSAEVWMVQFEAFSNPVATNHDDPLTLTGLGVGAGVSTEFNFDGLPSGANLFGMVGTSSTGLIVFGTTTLLKADGTYKNPGSDVIQTSQAGPNATIGINSQMYDPGELTYFTFVRNPDANFTSFNLDPNEADDADNMLYGAGNPGNDTIEANGAFLKVAQTQSGGTASMSITAYNINGSPQGRDLIAASGQNAVAITQVKVYAADGITVLEDSSVAGAQDPTISITITGGVATISGIAAGYKIEWFTNGLHDQVKVTGVTGKFDIGGFGVNEPTAVSAPLTGVRFEDDGPVVDLVLNGAAELRLDETDNDADDLAVGGILATNTLAAAAYLTTNDADFGTDGEAGLNPTVWSLALTGANAAGVDSGLDDAVTNSNVMLFVVNATTIVGKVGGAAGDVVMTITINDTTGALTVVQNRAVEHNDPGDHDENGTSSAMMNSGLVAAVRTITDGDLDTASDNVDVSQVIKFEDDGPDVDINLNPTAELRLDETDNDADDLAVGGILATNSLTAAAYLALNSAFFGSDGAAAASPTVWSLSLTGANATGVDSGIDDAVSNNNVMLFVVNSTTIVGRDGGAAGAVVMTISINATTGALTVVQNRAVEHNDSGDNDENSSPEVMDSGLIAAVRTITDGDGDSDSDSVDVSQVIKLEDDGPDVDINLNPAAALLLDETENDGDDTAIDGILATNSLAAATYLNINSAFFGSDQAAASDSSVWSLALTGANAAGVDSGLDDAVSDNAVMLFQTNSTTIVGRDGGPGGDVVMTITINATTGALTVVQNRAVEHDNSLDHDELTSPEVMDSGLIAAVRTITDGDGDSDSDSVDVSQVIKLEDDGPILDLDLLSSAELLVDETTLGDTDLILAGDLFSIVTEEFGSDGEGTTPSAYKLVVGNANSGLFDTLTGLQVLLSLDLTETVITGSVDDGGTDVSVFTIEIDAVTGEVTLTQLRAMVHDEVDDPNEALFPLTLEDGTVLVERTITDGDGDSDSDTVDISPVFKFRDDGPVLLPPTDDIIELRTDDTDIADTATLSTDLIFPTLPDFGSDGPNAIDPVLYELRIDSGVPGSDPNDSGLIDTETGDKVLVVKVGDDIVGYVDEDGSGAIEAGETLEAIRFSLTEVDLDSETVTFTQSRSVVHDNVNDPVEAGGSAATIASNLIELDQIAVDGDGDVSGVVSFDLGAITFLEDDGPDIGPISNGLVQFAITSSVSNSLEGVVGNDPNASPYILTDYTETLTVNGVALEGVLQNSATQVTYYADTDGDLEFGSAGDTAYYRLALTQAGEGDYTFTVLIDPPPALTEFRFDDLPSGSNLFGIVGDAAAGLIIFGKNIVLKADNTYIANQTQEVKTSQAGIHDTIGIESQMFDPGDAAYFTFVSVPDPNFTGTALGSTEADDADNILYGSTLENDSAFIRIAQLQGNTDPSMSIQLFNIAGSPQGEAMLDARGTNAAGKDPDVIAVRVYDALGNLLEDTGDLVNFDDPDIIVSFLNGVATVTGFGTDFKVEWDADEDFDQTLITGVGGKFDIGGFGFNQVNDTPDQLLEFTAQVTDGDGDTDTASWKVGIDGTGVFDDNLVSGVII